MRFIHKVHSNNNNANNNNANNKKERNTMPRYIIERDIPDIGSAEREALRDAASQSNGVLAAMKAEQKNIQWEHSYVAGNKTFCIYIADNEALIDEHAERSGFPASKVTEVRKMIDPVTAEG